MDDRQRVGLPDRIRDLSEHAHRLELRERCAAQAIVERLSAEEVGDDEEAPGLVAPHFDQLEGVRVAQLRDDPGLDLEAPPQLRGGVATQDLDRDVAVHGELAGAIHHAHRPATDLFLDAIAILQDTCPDQRLAIHVGPLVGFEPVLALVLLVTSSSTTAEMLEREGDIGSAIIALEADWAKTQDPAAELRLAEAYARWPDHCEEARRHFEGFLRRCSDDPARARAERGLAELRQVCTVPLGIEVEGLRIDDLEPPERLWAGHHFYSVGDGPWHAFCVEPPEVPRLKIEREDPPPEDPEAHAKLHEAAAYAHVRATRYCPAIGELMIANTIDPSPGYLFNIAVAYQRWGRCVPAIETFERYLLVCPDCEPAARAKREIEALRAQCEAQLTITSVPRGVTVRVDGVERGETPVVLRLPPGGHDLVVGPRRRPIHLEARSQREVAIVLEPPRVTTPPPPVVIQESVDLAPIAAFGVGGAALVVGVVFAAASAGARSDLDSLHAMGRAGMPIQRSDAQAIADVGVRDRAIAYTGFGVAVGAIATGVILWVLDEEAP